MRLAGGAHRGLGMWLAQRASALYMAGFIPAFLVWLLGNAPLNYLGWRDAFQPLFSRLAMLLFVLTLLVHAWIGLREILIDYVHHLLTRLGLYFLFATLYLGCLAWAADILWSAG